MKNIPKSDNNSISSISANKEIVDQACPPYQETLEKSCSDFKLNFSLPNQNEKKMPKRQRKSHGWTHPSLKHVKTNIGQ